TGSGKTVLFAFIVENAAKRLGNSVYILGHRDEIIQQISEALDIMDVAHGVIAAGYPQTEAPVQICSVQTLWRRLHKLTKPPDLIIIAEWHYRIATTFRAIIDACPNAKLVGVTATPERLDGKG